jgi:hypothetical protein
MPLPQPEKWRPLADRDNHVLDPGLVPGIRENNEHLVAVAYKEGPVEIGGDGGANEDPDEALHDLLSPGATERSHSGCSRALA